MILEALHSLFLFVKFLFGLGALCALLVIGLVVLWYVLRVVTGFTLRGQPAHRFTSLRRLFLDR